jgi:beta-galactosidase
MITLGAQYYRPPFPNDQYWDDDMRRMADAGLNTVQLWVLWGWVEPSPGEWQFDDYDRLVDLAGKHGLGVVLSAISEIQPYWIHRAVPGSEMIDNMGHTVVSSNRRECHFGLTPGGCTDHPQVWQRMEQFFSQVVTRYRSAPHLRGWDAWNELRWNVQADGLVCYCPQTLAAYRRWLDEKHGGLDGLNRAWQRRYRSWDDVLPGKSPERPYTEMMAFEHFITWRANQLGIARAQYIKALDPTRPVTVHGASPTVLHGGDTYPTATALHRGNDWVFADHLDGIGCSSFPNWSGIDLADYTARIDYLTAAARGKRIWLSELQGGRAATGDKVHQPVPPAPQQRWLWSGVANGADTILFWCWRDEVFGHESSGFGIIGTDGYAEHRVAALRKTGALLQQHEQLLGGYKPDAADAGVFFSPQSYYQNWAYNGTAIACQDAIQGYARALVRANIPYTVVEEEHLDALAGVKVLFLPRTHVVDNTTADRLAGWVQRGGTLVCESECGAFAGNGIYRYPHERFLARLTGVAEVGRRALNAPSVTVTLSGRTFTLPAKQWLTPYAVGKGAPLAQSTDGPVVVDVLVGKGRVLLCGAYLGDAYFDGSSRKNTTFAPFCDDFEQWLATLTRSAGVVPPVELVQPTGAGHANVRVRVGSSRGKRVVFVFLEDASSATLRFGASFFAGAVTDVISGAPVALHTAAGGQECKVAAGEWGVVLLAEA